MLAELVESHRIHVPQFPVAFRPRSSPRRCAGRPELHAAQCTKLLRPRRRIRRPSHTQQNNRTISCSGWWFGTCFIFHNIWDNPSHWLSYFSRWLKHVKTTNQCCFVVWPADVVIEPLLVGGLEHELYLSIQLGMSSSQLTNSIIFQRGWLKPPTRWLLYSPSLTIITISIDPYINSILTRVK